MGKELLDILNTEQKQETNKELKIVNNPVLEEIKINFENTFKTNSNRMIYDNNFAYDYCCSLLPKAYDSEDIITFTKMLKFYEKEQYPIYWLCWYAGNYINALINNCKSKKIILDTTHLETRLYNLGFRNEKRHIIINGNCGVLLGNEMRSGLIEANGDCWEWIGSCMTGGTIRLNGDYAKLSPNIAGGNIYHKNKQIIKDGKPLDGIKIK